MNQIQQKIHDGSMHILSTMGYKVTDIRILEAMTKAGFRVEGELVYFTEKQVMDAVKQAPKSFTLRARNPEKDMVIGEGPTKLGGGYGCTFVVGNDGIRRDATLVDFKNFAKLVHNAGCFDFNGGILVQPSDLDTSNCYPTMLYATMVLSDMPLLGFSSHETDVQHCMELCEIVFGGHDAFVSDYHLLTLVNLLTPLQLGDFGEQSLWVAAQYNQPVVLSPGTTFGATVPMSPAGSATVGNAEILATLTIAQTLRPGLPVIYGLMGSCLNMGTGTTQVAHPVVDQVRSLGRNLAVEYGLPSRNGGGVCDAPRAGIQSTFEGTVCLMNSLRENTSLSIHAAGILDSFMSMSYEKFIMDCEAIRTIKRSMEPIDVSDAAIGMDAIEAAGIGGNFLVAMHTLQNCRTYAWQSPFNSRPKPEGTDLSNGDVEYMENVTKHWESVLESYTCPTLDSGIQGEMANYLTTKLGVAPEIIATIDEI